MTEFLDQKQAKQEGKKNLIYSYLNITNNFIVKGSTFIEFHLNNTNNVNNANIGNTSNALENINNDRLQRAPNNTFHKFRIQNNANNASNNANMINNNENRILSLLTYLVLWSEDTIQIYQILGGTNNKGDNKILDTSLQCSSSQINGRINSIKCFRRDNQVYLLCLLEKKKMITLLYDRTLNCLSCVTQHCFNSSFLMELNATCLDNQLDDDSVRHHNFQGQTDMNSFEQNNNELVAVLISRRILALCFTNSYYDAHYKAIQNNNNNGGLNNNNNLMQFNPFSNSIYNQPQYSNLHIQHSNSNIINNNAANNINNNANIINANNNVHPEMKQNKIIFAPQIFYLDLQKKYEVTVNKFPSPASVTNPLLAMQQQQQQQLGQPFNIIGSSYQQFDHMRPQIPPLPGTTATPLTIQQQSNQIQPGQKIPYIFLINKKIIHIKEQQGVNANNLGLNNPNGNTNNPTQSNLGNSTHLGINNLETPVYEVIKVIQTELIIIKADLTTYAQNQQASLNPVDASSNINGLPSAFGSSSFNPSINPNQQTTTNTNSSLPQFNDKFEHLKHSQFTRLPSNTYLIKALENNLILIMSNYYLYLGTPTKEFHEFTCLAFHHPKYHQDQSNAQKDFQGQIILNEQNIEEGLENVQFEQLDRNRILMRGLKKIFLLEIQLNQYGQLGSMEIRFVRNFSLQTQSFCARNCLDSQRNEYDLMFMNSKYSDTPTNNNIFLLTSTEDVVEKKIKKEEFQSSNSLVTLPQAYKLNIKERFDNWGTIRDISFCEKERPQFMNYYFMTGDINGKNTIHKCERAIRTKRIEMDQWFKTEDQTERIFEIDDAYYIISCRSGRTIFYKKQDTKFIIFSYSHLFMTNISTIAITKGSLIDQEQINNNDGNNINNEENCSRPIFIQMGLTQLRVVDINNQTYQDISVNLGNNSNAGNNNESATTQTTNANVFLNKLVYICNTIFVMDTEQNLHTFSFIQGRWEVVDYLGGLTKDRFVISIQKVQPYFSTISSSSCSEFLFVGFPNEFSIYSAQYQKHNGLIRFTKRYEAHYVKEGLVFLQNGLMHLKKEVLKDHLVRSITDPSIKLSYDPRETQNTYVCEYAIEQLQKSLVLIIKLNSGDIYVYKGILKTNMETIFPYDFQRIPLRCMQYINVKPSNNINLNLINNNGSQSSNISEKQLYSFHKQQQGTIFRNHSIDCVIISDIGRQGVCITIFENNTQEIFFHLMILSNAPSIFNSLAPFSLIDQNKPLAKGFLIPIDGKIIFYQMPMQLKYNNSFIYESPPQLQQYNPLFMDIVRVKIEPKQSQQNPNQEDTENYKKYIVLVNQIGNNKQEIRLVDEEDHSITTLVKTLPENEKVYKFKTFEGTNKKNNFRFKIQMVGYLTINQKENDEVIESRFYCHYFQGEQMLEMANSCKYQDFIFDFCFLNFPNTTDPNSSEHFKVVLMERDKVMTLNFVKNQISQGKDDGPYHQRLMISSIWNNKQYFLAGDIQKGVQLYEMDEIQSKPRLIGEENININVRQCVLFSIQNKNALRALITDEARNVYAYSFTSQSQQNQQEQIDSKRKIRMELIASFHVGSKINKITTDYKSSDTQMQDAVSHLLLQKQDGNVSVIQLIYEPGENTLLFDLQQTIFEELPYLAGLDPREFRETKQINPSYKLKNAHSFFETSIVDVYFNLTRPLQEKIASKLNRSREDFIKIIIETILS